ncbi:hypothetical protein SDRG_04598 [Saprolegnia diclina VS20]|uniref:Uncharacterized protein n=1 Tax=Saprolegnia diclina (strain VS20) TaxID=1156394 RepID=T0QJG0_SAPDV|nr:hypothetical protein SDRG_04598 [Saprolegnia diclina VS20]EQC38169.1 hypothetical protein SDRG_04598 [Saprolegnia diclina VS20]|eukprot:XP_008608496.1 hypothetical protein SDRG_04598 [Saprolegnia diclina VS20]
MCPAWCGHQILTLALENNKLRNVPENLPPTLQKLWLSANDLTDINALATTGLELLDIANNNFTTISNVDLRSLTTLSPCPNSPRFVLTTIVE